MITITSPLMTSSSFSTQIARIAFEGSSNVESDEVKATVNGTLVDLVNYVLNPLPPTAFGIIEFDFIAQLSIGLNVVVIESFLLGASVDITSMEVMYADSSEFSSLFSPPFNFVANSYKQSSQLYWESQSIVDISYFYIYMSSDPDLEPASFELIQSISSDSGSRFTRLAETFDETIFDPDTNEYIQTVKSVEEEYYAFQTTISIPTDDKYFIVVSSVRIQGTDVIESRWSNVERVQRFEIPSSTSYLPIPTRKEISADLVEMLGEDYSGLDIFPGTAPMEFQINPVSTILNKLYKLEEFKDIIYNLAALVKLDDPEGSGTSSSPTTGLKGEYANLFGIDPSVLQSYIDSWFDNHASNHGITRLPAKFAFDAIVIYFLEEPTESFYIKKGERLKAPKEKTNASSDLFYEVQSTYFVDINTLTSIYNAEEKRWEAQLYFVCITSGEVGNVGTDAFSEMTGNYPVPVYGYNSAPIVSGRDRQSNNDLAKLVFLSVQGLDTASRFWFEKRTLDFAAVENTLIVGAGDPRMIRDYDWIREKNIGGKVDVYVKDAVSQATSETHALYPTVMYEFVFTNDGFLRCKDPAISHIAPIGLLVAAFSSTRAANYSLLDSDVLDGRFVDLDFSTSSGGGGNLLVNADVEAGFPYVTGAGVQVTSNLTEAQSSLYVFGGTYSMELTLDSTGVGTYALSGAVSTSNIVTLGVTPANTYDMLIYAYIPGSNGVDFIQIEIQDYESGSGWETTVLTFSAVNTWTPVAISRYVRSAATGIQVNIKVSGTLGQACYIDSLNFEQSGGGNLQNSLIGWAPGELVYVTFDVIADYYFIKLGNRPALTLSTVVLQDSTDVTPISNLEHYSAPFLEGRSISALDYVIVDATTGALPEITTFLFTDDSANSNANYYGKYFTFNDGSNAPYYVWFDNSGAAYTDPAPGGTGVRVVLAIGDDNLAVAGYVETEIDALLGFGAVDNLDGTVTVTNVVSGDADDATVDDITSVIVDFNIVQQGQADAAITPIELSHTELDLKLYKSQKIYLEKAGVISDTIIVTLADLSTLDPINYILELEEEFISVQLATSFTAATVVVRIDYDHYVNCTVAYTYDSLIAMIQESLTVDISMTRENLAVKKVEPQRLKLTATTYLNDYGRRLSIDRSIKLAAYQYLNRLPVSHKLYQSKLIAIMESDDGVRNVAVPLDKATFQDTRFDLVDVTGQLTVDHSLPLVYKFTIPYIDPTKRLFLWASQLCYQVDTLGDVDSYEGAFFLDDSTNTVYFQAYDQKLPSQTVVSYAVAEQDIDLESIEVPLIQSTDFYDFSIFYIDAEE